MDPSDVWELCRAVLKRQKASASISQASNQPRGDSRTWSMGESPRVSSVAEEQVQFVLRHVDARSWGLRGIGVWLLSQLFRYEKLSSL